MKKLYISFVTLITVFTHVDAQTYYGEKSFGRLQIINDSMGTVTFISYLASRSVDDCSIRKHGDTVFLSTNAQWRYKVNVFDEEQTAVIDRFGSVIATTRGIDTLINFVNPRIATVIKIYRYSFPDKKYEYLEDDIGIYDSITNSIILETNAFYRGNYIIVYKDFSGYYRVKCSFKKDVQYVVLEKNPDDYWYQGVLVFNEFPLLIKRNRLIPIDKEKQLDCWLDNGFFFPKMKLSKKSKEYNVINGHYIGLRNLPTEIRKGISKPLPRKYRMAVSHMEQNEK